MVMVQGTFLTVALIYTKISLMTVGVVVVREIIAGLEIRIDCTLQCHHNGVRDSKNAITGCVSTNLGWSLNVPFQCDVLKVCLVWYSTICVVSQRTLKSLFSISCLYMKLTLVICSIPF